MDLLTPIREFEPRRRRLTVAEYYKMAEVGILGWDERVELIDGEIFEMAPIGPQHSSCVDILNILLARKISSAHWLRVQNPLQLSQYKERYPDLAVVHFRPDRYASAVPQAKDVLIAIEVADTTLKSDQSLKIPDYAQAGIPEVWLIDLVHQVVEVFSDPKGGMYQKNVRLSRGEQITSITTGLTFDVSEIIPQN